MLKAHGLQEGTYLRIICSCIILAAVSLVAVFAVMDDGGSMEEVDADDEWQTWDDNIKWKYDSSRKILFIQPNDPTQEAGIKNAGRGADNLPPWADKRYDGMSICLSDDILYIGDCAFWNWHALGSLYVGDERTPTPESGIEFPSRLRSIGGGAFEECYLFTGILIFPDTLETIGSHAFDQCHRITGSLVIPDSVTSIGLSAFTGCNLNGDIYIGNGVKEIPNSFCEANSPNGYLVIAGRIESIGDKAFAGCSNLVGEIDTSYMTSIGEYAFSGCAKLTGKVELDRSLSKLGVGAFEGCAGLTGNLRLPQNEYITEVLENTFKGCSGLNGTLTVPETITKIGKSAFEGCSGISILRLENAGVKDLVIDDYAFANCSSMRIEGDSGLDISDAQTIGSYAFYNCPGLAGPLKVRTSGYNGGGFAFAECTGFTSVKLSTRIKQDESVTCTVHQHAFYNCTGLKEIEIEMLMNNVHYDIMDYAFAGCTGVTGALRLHTDISYVGSNAFAGCTNILTVHLDYAQNHNYAPDSLPSHTFYIDGEAKTVTEADDKTRYSGPDSTHLSAVSATVPLAYPLFDVDGGSESAPIMGEMAQGVKFPLPGYSGQKEGMKFSGWLYDDAVYQPGDELAMGADDMAFKAVWTEKARYDVTYDLDGGSGKLPQQHGYEGDTIYLMTYDGRKPGFDFTGWLYNGLLYMPADTITMPDGDITVIAYWSSMPRHTVSYDIDGGSEAAPQSRDISRGLAFLLPDYKGVKAGYIFSGWLHDGKVKNAGDRVIMGDRDMGFIARWTPVHSVFYDIAGGSGDVPDTEVVQEGEMFTAAECTAYKEGFRFSGWSYGSETFMPGDGIEMGISNITLTAVWKKGYPAHSVFYDANGGSEDVPIQGDVEEGSSFTIKMYSGTKDGYVFGGWSYDGNIYDTGDRVTMGKSDIMLTAVWNEEGSFLDGGAIMIICAAAAGIIAVCAAVFCIMRHY